MKNEFDNRLTDKGWRSMRRLLDREMPEQRRRRRFAWWPLALLLLPLAGAGGWWWMQPSEPAQAAPMPKEHPKISQPVAANENTVAVPAASAAESTPPRRVKTPNGTPPRLVFSPSESSVSAYGVVSNVGALGENDKRNGKPLSQEASATETAGTSSPDGLNASGDPDETFRKFSTFGKLDAISVVPQSVENETNTLPAAFTVTPSAAKIIKKQPQPCRWSFGLAAGLASENFSSLNGFSAGAAADWQFARKWGLRSGLQYVQYRLPADERPVVSVAADDYTEATGNLVLSSGGSSNPYQDSASSSPVLVPVERLRQLEMPLMAYWQPIRPLRIFGGVSLACNLSAKASEQNYSNNQSYYAYTKEAQNNLNKLTASNLQRWQMNWQTGVGVRLGRHLELGAFYKQGIAGTSENNTGNYDASGNFNSDPQPAGGGISHYFLFNGIWFF